MADETIVAVYDTPAHAQLAVADLEAAGVPPTAISQHASGAAEGAGSVASAGTAHEAGFWSRLFGGEPDYDTAVYSRSVQAGSTVVTVNVPEAHVATAMQVLESHQPIDIDERASSYGLTATAPATTGVATSGVATTPSTVAGGDTIQLAEERLAVGKRVINRGGTRIRRYVVETPVEEQVTLREEMVTLERRPVTDGRAVADGNFSEKVIEMTQTAEEAVVSKTAHVTEEVALKKQAADRVETVRDTVRREDVAVEQIPAETVKTTVPPKI